MSNKTSGSAYQPCGRSRRQQTSPLTQSYVPSSDEDSLIGSETDASSAPSSPPQTIRHRRKASRIEDVNELNIDFLSLSPIDLSLTILESTVDNESKQLQPLPKSPEPPTPPPKNSPTLTVEPLRIRKKPIQGTVKPKLSIVTSPPPPMVSLRPVRLLVASIGNPKPYHSTRHSAGHHLLQALRSQINFPLLTKSKTGLVAFGRDAGRPEITLWQSTSSMNVSGKNLLQGWKNFVDVQSTESGSDVVTALVVLHDELESAPGTLKVRKGDSSAKGHNGLKSIQMSFKGANWMAQLGDKRYIRVGVGIGRPGSRDRGDVSAYVLGQLSAGEKKTIENKGDELLGILEREMQTLATLS